MEDNELKIRGNYFLVVKPIWKQSVEDNQLLADDEPRQQPTSGNVRWAVYCIWLELSIQWTAKRQDCHIALWDEYNIEDHPKVGGKEVEGRTDNSELDWLCSSPATKKSASRYWTWDWGQTWTDVWRYLREPGDVKRWRDLTEQSTSTTGKTTLSSDAPARKTVPERISNTWTESLRTVNTLHKPESWRKRKLKLLLGACTARPVGHLACHILWEKWFARVRRVYWSSFSRKLKCIQQGVRKSKSQGQSSYEKEAQMPVSSQTVNRQGNKCNIIGQKAPLEGLVNEDETSRYWFNHGEDPLVEACPGSEPGTVVTQVVPGHQHGIQKQENSLGIRWPGELYKAEEVCEMV